MSEFPRAYRRGWKSDDVKVFVAEAERRHFRPLELYHALHLDGDKPADVMRKLRETGGSAVKEASEL